MPGSRILVIVTGSIAAAKACEAISQLVQRGHRVRCVASRSALNFVGPAMLEGLTGAPALTDLFAPGAALEHIELTRWADLVLVCPATANTVNRFAAGLADDLPGAIFLARDPKKPWLAAPAMNPAMWAHPATCAAVERLRSWGVDFIAVGAGRTACGEVGEGRMAEPQTIVAAVEAALSRTARPLRVLVTAGGTAEPVDAVRVLTNRSTGATGALVASHLRRRGHAVTLLRARSAVAPEVPGEEEQFETLADLDAALTRRLAAGAFDAVIHAAAVSDFAVEPVAAEPAGPPARVGKLDSRAAPVLRLRLQPKLVDTLRARSPAPLRIVAFKLTSGASEAEARAAVAELGARSGADLVVQNDTTANGGPGGEFPAVLFHPDGSPVERCSTRLALAEALERWLANGEGAGNLAGHDEAARRSEKTGP